MASYRDHTAQGTSSARSGPVSDRILIVEADLVISDLIGRQALQSAGYQVQIASDATTAIAHALQWGPDLILVDLQLPGLSGKDLIVALTSQGIHTPLIVIAQRGAETDIIQTFRLGASDFLLLPARETEVINVVNRVLKQVHERRERERLAHQLQQANQELQMRVRELTTIFALGRAMTSITDQADLLDKILDASVRTTQADLGWFLLREDANRPFVVAAYNNLPASLGVRLQQPWDDGISSLVAMSGEVLAIHGEALRRFKISSLGMSALIVPIKAQKVVLGLLVMMRKTAAPFGISEQHLLDALADYASISLLNARLVRVLEERARLNQQTASVSQLVSKVNHDILLASKEEVSGPMEKILATLEMLAKDSAARMHSNLRQQLAGALDELQRISQVAAGFVPVSQPGAPLERLQTNLTELLTQSTRRMLPFAQQLGVSFTPVRSPESVIVGGDAGLLAQALDGLFRNLLKLSKRGAHFSIQLERTSDYQAHLVVQTGARAISQRDAERLFEEKETSAAIKSPGEQSGMPGISLSLVKEIFMLHNGRIWVASSDGKGSDFHVVLPLAR